MKPLQWPFSTSPPRNPLNLFIKMYQKYQMRMLGSVKDRTTGQWSTESGNIAANTEHSFIQIRLPSKQSNW